MAIDWKQEVSLSTITDFVRHKSKGTGGSSAYPSKTTMNLYQSDAKEGGLRRTIILGVLMAIGIALFTKFGVIDRLALVTEKESELARQQQTLQMLRESTDEFAQLKDDYESFALTSGSGSIDPVIVFSLIEKQVMPAAQVSNIQMSEGVLTLTLDNASLETAGKIANSLRKQEVVKMVNVSTATNQNQSSSGAKTKTTLVVTFVTAASAEED